MEEKPGDETSSASFTSTASSSGAPTRNRPDDCEGRGKHLLSPPSGASQTISNLLNDDGNYNELDDRKEVASDCFKEVITTCNVPPSSSSSSSTTTTTTVTSTEPPMHAKVVKRTDVISWDDYFMAVAFLSAKRSKDPSTQVGACIVNPDKRIVGIGYNGFPRGCSDDELPWARDADSLYDTKYPYVCHAEVNAVLNKNSAEVRGCSIYVALFPCNDCAKILIQSGILEVVYYSDKKKEDVSFRASRRMLAMAKVKVRHYRPTTDTVLIDFSTIESTSSNNNNINDSKATGQPQQQQQLPEDSLIQVGSSEEHLFSELWTLARLTGEALVRIMHRFLVRSFPGVWR